MSTASETLSLQANGADLPDALPAGRRAAATLRATGVLWFVLAIAGQLMMAAYVMGFYLRAALAGDLPRWNQVLHNGYIPGDSIGNAALMLHMLFTVLIVAGGALQLLPQVRRRWPWLHRWNGRFYLLSALVLSCGGLYLIWTRDSLSGTVADIAISINAVLIMAFSVLAWRNARARRLDVHRRWALRLFMAVSGVWFFRVGLMFWLLVNQGPVGFDPGTFRGPFLDVLGFLQYLLPLAVLEIYLRVQVGGSAPAKLMMAASLGVLTLAMAVGIGAATLMMWLPRL